MRDNDTPGRVRPAGAAGHLDRGRPHGRHRGRRDHRRSPTSCWSSSPQRPAPGTTSWCTCCSTRTARRRSRSSSTDGRVRSRRRRTITFTSADGDWNIPVRLVVTPRDNDRRQDPRTAVIEFERDSSTTDAAYLFPTLYAPPARVAIEVIDDETAGAVVLESGGGTLVGLRRRHRRLLHPPDQAADGDVGHRDPHRRAHRRGDDQRRLRHATADRRLPRRRSSSAAPSRRHDGSGRITITRADVGSFLDEGFAPGPVHPHRGRWRAPTATATSPAVSESTITLTTRRRRRAAPSPRRLISRLVRARACGGRRVDVRRAPTGAHRPRRRLGLARRRLPRGPARPRLHDSGATCADFKIALHPRRQRDQGREARVHRRGRLPVQRQRRASTVTRLAAVATFTGTRPTPNAWYKQQRIELVADTDYSLPPGRESVKVFPVSTHLLSKLRGPLAVEGGPTAADRSLRNGVKLPGETRRVRCSRSRRRRPRARRSTSSTSSTTRASRTAAAR